MVNLKGKNIVEEIILKTPLEIERKYLIDMPSEEVLAAYPSAFFMDIEQTYLISTVKGESARVRRIKDEGGHIRYVKTEKKRINARTCEENEYELSKEVYEAELFFRDINRRTIYKRRYVLPYGSYKLEIDIYPFWKQTAILEVELSREDEEVDFPRFLHILREVSDEKRFKNRALARVVPDESDIRAE